MLLQKFYRAPIITALLCAGLHAQSVLSVQCPAGLPVAHSAGPSLSIGGAGTGVQNDFFGMADNVANLGGMNRAVFSAVTSFDFLEISQTKDHTRHFALSPRLFSFAFPINPVGSFGFSVDKRNTLNYRFDSTITFDLNGSSVAESLCVSVVGGLSSWQAGWGRAIGRWALAGISYERIYLSSDDITLYSAAINGIGKPRYDSLRCIFRGNALRGGILLPVGKLTAGMTGEYPFKGNASRILGSNNTDSGGLGTQKFLLKLPPSLSLGVSYAVSPEWMAAVSGGITLWQEYSSQNTLGGNVGNALSFSAGTQYIPAPNLLVPRYWEIMQYRMGFRYSKLPVVTASEFAFNASIGLPLLRGGGLVDLIAEFGKRSDSRLNYSDTFLQLFIGINGGRKWSQSTGIRY